MGRSTVGIDATQRLELGLLVGGCKIVLLDVPGCEAMQGKYRPMAAVLAAVLVLHSRRSRSLMNPRNVVLGCASFAAFTVVTALSLTLSPSPKTPFGRDANSAFVARLALALTSVSALRKSPGIREREHVSDELVFIGIDDASIAVLGDLPWSRSLYGKLLERLARARARAVAFGLDFPDRDPHGTATMASAMHDIPTILGYSLNFLPGSRPDDSLLAPGLASAAAASGFTTVDTASGLLVGQPAFLRTSPGSVRTAVSFPVAVAQQFLNAKAVPTADGLQFGGRTIRLDDGVLQLDPFPAALNARGSLVPAFAPSESFYRALTMPERELAKLVEGRLVLVGVQSHFSGGDIVTPAGIFPGAFINLRLVDELLRFRSISEAPRALEIALVILMPLVAFALSFSLRAALSIVLVLAICFSEAILSAVSYLQSGLYFDVLHAAGAAVLVGFVTTGTLERHRFIVDRETKRALAEREQELRTERATSAALAEHNAALQRFVPREFLEYLHRDNILKVELGDQVQRSMVILFSDIRGFTELAERMTPQETFDFLNDYLGRVGPIIRAHGGFIDKYIGDAIMGLFSGQSDTALRAAIELQVEVRRFATERAFAGQAPVAAGVGLHEGTLILGTIGERERMDTTVIADAVNVSARIESLTKVYGASILVSEALVKTLKHPEDFAMRSLGAMRVQGKAEPLEVFEILDGDATKMREEKDAASSAFATALAHFRAGRFDDAARGFGEALNTCPGDNAARYYLARCTELSMHAPATWDGAEEIAKK